MTVTTGRAHGLRTIQEARGVAPGDGIELAYRFWPGAGPAVVALHGVTASAANFVGVADQLAGRRPLLAFDLRGRGDSDKPEAPYGMAQHADDVATAMRTFRLDSTVVVGHSMGAYVAVALAARHPELVAGLVLVDGGLPVDLPEGVVAADFLDVMIAPQMARLRQTFASRAAYLDFWRELPTFVGGRWNSYVEAYLHADLGGQEPELRPKASEAAVRADTLDTLGSSLLRNWLAALEVPVVLLRAPEGFAPGTPPLLADDVVTREAPSLREFRDRVIADTTHYTIALGVEGAREVADEIVRLAEDYSR